MSEPPSFGVLLSSSAPVPTCQIRMMPIRIENRPPLLPEDVRYMGLLPPEIDLIAPRLAGWLTQVFRVMGGYVFATGVLTIAIAATSFRERRLAAAVGILIAGAASIGLMAAINFMIDSNFKWVLLGMALVWALSLGLLLFEPNPSA